LSLLIKVAPEFCTSKYKNHINILFKPIKKLNLKV
jgi:hypothetical protein